MDKTPQYIAMDQTRGNMKIITIISLFILTACTVPITKTYHIVNIVDNGSTLVQAIDPITTTADVKAIP